MVVVPGFSGFGFIVSFVSIAVYFVLALNCELPTVWF